MIYAAAQSGRAQGGGDSLPEAAVAPPPVTQSIPNVSTEITSISIVELRRAPIAVRFRLQLNGAAA